MWRPEGWKPAKALNHPLHCFSPDDCLGHERERSADEMLTGIIDKLRKMDPQTNVQAIITELEQKRECPGSARCLTG